MGCDIHMVAQQRYGESEWQDLAYPAIDRNYTLFAVLANVRNGHGFAGVKTGEPVPFISEPRGLPEDFEISRDYQHPGDQWLGDHSHSYLSLDEVLAYDWGQIKHSVGVVKADEYQQWLRNGIPDSWCGGVGGGRVRNVSNGEMERLIAAGDTDLVYTSVTWSRPLRESIGDSWFKLLDWLASTQTDYRKVRLVFGFDS